MNSQSIWIERQNKPSLIVGDLSEYAPADAVYETLLRRGVFKWLAVRRDIIRLKNTWKKRVTTSITEQKKSHSSRVTYLRGYRKALEECRAEVRALCHSARWQCPDHDRRALRWLESRGKQ